MRSLIDAALEDQARRVLEAKPLDLMGSHSIAMPPCKNCGLPLRSSRRTGLSGYCHRTKECKGFAQKARSSLTGSRRVRPGKPCGLCGGRTISVTGYCYKNPCRAQQGREERKRMLNIARGVGLDAGNCASCGKPLSMGGRPNISGYCRSGACQYKAKLARTAKKKAWVAA